MINFRLLFLSLLFLSAKSLAFVTITPGMLYDKNDSFDLKLTKTSQYAYTFEVQWRRTINDSWMDLGRMSPGTHQLKLSNTGTKYYRAREVRRYPSSGSQDFYSEWGEADWVTLWYEPYPVSSISSTETFSEDGTFKITWGSAYLSGSYEWQVLHNGELSGYTNIGSAFELEQSEPDGQYTYFVRGCNNHGCGTPKTITVTVDIFSYDYEYDELGRLIEATDPKNGVRTFDYDDAGNRSNVFVTPVN